jgi:hypothetical protein
MDEHVGGGGGVEIARHMFSKFPNYTMGAVNAETNAGIHTMSRAMMEANDLNDWFNCADPWCTRLHFRTASFCTERSGHFDAFDQGPVHVFGLKFTLKDAIEFHAFALLEASMRVINGIPLGCSPLLPVGTVNTVQTLKASRSSCRA